MEAAGVWVKGIAAAILMVSMVSALLPKGLPSRGVGIIGSIIITAMIISPIKSFDLNVLEKYAESYENEVGRKTEAFLGECENLKGNVITGELSEYILQRTKEMGIICEISVKADEKGELSAEVSTKTEEEFKAVSKIAEELGIKRIIRRQRGVE